MTAATRSRWMRWTSLPVALLFLSAVNAPSPGAIPAPGSAEPPAWVREHFEDMVGRWVAQNDSYRNENEPFDAYGMEWTWGLGQKSIKGRLFGLNDGSEVGTFWEYRVFWHPGEGKLMIYQFGGDGTVGTGTVEHTGARETRALQAFYNPDGTTVRVGHRDAFREGERHIQSFNVGDDGTWTERRSYVWHRDP